MELEMLVAPAPDGVRITVAPGSCAVKLRERCSQSRFQLVGMLDVPRWSGSSHGAMKVPWSATPSSHCSVALRADSVCQSLKATLT